MFTENLLSVVKRLGFVITMKRGRNQYAEHAERLWQQSKSKVIPEEYRKYTLIEFGPQGDYYISSKLRKLFQETRDA